MMSKYRLAVFTSQFPAKICTFFTRDIESLCANGLEIDIFSIYPLDSNLWQYVQEDFSRDIRSRKAVHHIGFVESLKSIFLIKPFLKKVVLKQVIGILGSSLKYGFPQLAKNFYLIPKAMHWAVKYQARFDHVLAYWGNYAGTCAYIFNQLVYPKIPFSLFLHAGTDLYRDRIYLANKINHAVNVITCSEFNRNFLLKNYSVACPDLENKIHIYHHGLDISDFPFIQNGREEDKILAVGRLSAKKGFDYLIQAVKELKSIGQNYKLEIIGEGPEKAYLHNLAEKLEIIDSVQFSGWLPFNEVQQAMTSGTLLVHPSPCLGDGVPNVIKEAMASGLPVVATNISGIPEAVENEITGLLVEPKDINGLAKAIEKLMGNIQLRNRYSSEARKFVERKFDLSENGKLLAKLLLGSASN